MLIVSLLLGVCLVILTIVVFFTDIGIRDDLKKLNLLIEKEKDKIWFEEELEKKVENLLDIKYVNIAFIVCLIAFSLSITVLIFDYQTEDHHEKYRTTVYKFSNNSITKKTKICTRMIFSEDICRVINTETKSVDEIFGGDNEPNQSN